MEEYNMNHESLETKLIRQQSLYIKQLEEQLSVCEEKNKAQELLIAQLGQLLELFEEELTTIKTENRKFQEKEN